jgi:hypothetical protein
MTASNQSALRKRGGEDHRFSQRIKRKKIPASNWDLKRQAKLYTCGIHFQHKMAEAMGPQVFYNSIRDLKEAGNCWKSCRIVEVNITFFRWVKAQNLLSDRIANAAKKKKGGAS